MFLKECEQHFNTKCLYTLLKINRDAKPAEVKKAYYRQSMIWHPDKSSLDDDAKKLHTVKFQLLNKAYEILSDEQRRKVYDETGSVDDEELTINEDVLAKWRTVFKKVTKEDIDNYLDEYIGSEQQEKEIIEMYNEHDGDLNKLSEFVIGDVEQVKQVIDKLIARGELKSTKKYKASTNSKNEQRRQKRAAKEAKEAENVLKEIGGDMDLVAMIRAKNEKRANDNFLDSLAEKYASKKKKAKK